MRSRLTSVTRKPDAPPVSGVGSKVTSAGPDAGVKSDAAIACTTRAHCSCQPGQGMARTPNTTSKRKAKTRNALEGAPKVIPIVNQPRMNTDEARMKKGGLLENPCFIRGSMIDFRYTLLPRNAPVGLSWDKSIAPGQPVNPRGDKDGRGENKQDRPKLLMSQIEDGVRMRTHEEQTRHAHHIEKSAQAGPEQEAERAGPPGRRESQNDRGDKPKELDRRARGDKCDLQTSSIAKSNPRPRWTRQNRCASQFAPHVTACR